MLDLEIRSAILVLARQGRGVRAIARAVGVDRKSVRRVLADGAADVPDIDRPGQLDPWLDQVRALHADCRGNLARVHEELRARHGVVVAYSSLTRFCRVAQIGVTPKRAAGRYTFGPGEEMQHDTSPHVVALDGRANRLHCASVVLCFSRRRFVLYYPRWTRFHVRIFLTAALRFFGRSARRCMIDNSSVILTRGSGRDAVVAPEMQAFSDHFGFRFVAHEKGDANRSARVEGPFWHIENNFLPGRTFVDLADLNRQAVAWCEAYNARFHKSYGGVPDELFAVERPELLPLPDWVPDPVEVHPRKVDAEGFVTLHTVRYSVPEALIDRQVEVHEGAERIRVFDGHRLVAEHARSDRHGARVTLPEHRDGRRGARTPPARSPAEVALRTASPALGALCDVLRKQRGGNAFHAIRRLHRMWLDYPTDALELAVGRALEFGLADLARIERMTLRTVRGDFFRLPNPEGDDGR